MSTSSSSQLETNTILPLTLKKPGSVVRVGGRVVVPSRPVNGMNTLKQNIRILQEAARANAFVYMRELDINGVNSSACPTTHLKK